MKGKTKPYISVLMIVYNAEHFIKDSIDSVLLQTFIDFEFIIIDDGSTDNTLEIITSYKDNRLKLFSKGHNYIESLNFGLKQCSGKYIARMDADDIMHPNRLEIQYNLMESFPSVTICSSFAECFGDFTGIMNNGIYGYIENSLLLCLKGNFIIHPTAFIRRHFLIKHRLHYKDFKYAEDFKLWVDFAKKNAVFFIIPKLLLKYRISKYQISNINEQEQKYSAFKIRQEVLYQLINYTEPVFKERLKTLYTLLAHFNRSNLIDAESVFSTFFTILSQRKLKKIYGRNKR